MLRSWFWVGLPRWVSLAAALAGAAFGAGPAGAACSGDCDGNGTVSSGELVRGVAVVLGSMPASQCTALQGGGASIAAVVRAIKAASGGCATPTHTRTLPATPTATATPTPTVDHAPLIPCFDVYRTYAGLPISLPIAASDPEGGVLRYTAEMLPDGAELGEETGLLSWTPRADQLGPHDVHITVADDGVPPLSAETQLIFQVYPLDINANVAACLPTCDPATGCQSRLPSRSQDCCPHEPQVHVAEPLPDCPAGRVLFIGRNTDLGFGRLQNCDELLVTNQEQIGANIRINIEARCVSRARVAILRVFMETKLRKPLLDSRSAVKLDLGADGYVQRAAVILDVTSPGPFFDLARAEGNLTATLTDADGVVVSQQLRLILVNPQPPDPLPDDLQDVPDVPVGLASCSNLAQDVEP